MEFRLETASDQRWYEFALEKTGIDTCRDTYLLAKRIYERGFSNETAPELCAKYDCKNPFKMERAIAILERLKLAKFVDIEYIPRNDGGVTILLAYSSKPEIIAE
jgi:hypothetical protein